MVVLERPVRRAFSLLTLGVVAAAPRPRCTCETSNRTSSLEQQSPHGGNMRKKFVAPVLVEEESLSRLTLGIDCISCTG